MSNGFERPDTRPERIRPWLTLVDDLAGSLAAESTFTFLLGAGASLSSGAPSTRALESAWMSAYPTRLRSHQEVKEKLGTLTEREKRTPIAPLFEEMTPYIGYQCLAAFGRERPVLVVNLNWDDAIKQACDRLEVPCTVAELGEGAKKITEKLDGFTDGVFCLHLHNRLAGTHPIGYDEYETLRFDEDIRRLLATRFFSHQTVVVGASLTGEHDVTDLLLNLASQPLQKPEERRAFWIFSRQHHETTEPLDRATRKLLASKNSDRNFAGGPAVDFDRLLLELRSRLVRLAYPNRDHPHRGPQDLDHLALPSPKVLAGQLQAPPRSVFVIRGDAYIGKSSAANLLKFLAEISGDPAPEVSFATGAGACERALVQFNATPMAEAYANRLLVLEDPFGSTGTYEPNKAFVSALRAFVKQCGTGRRRSPSARLIITSRASAWQSALSHHGKVLEAVPTCSCRAEDWYSTDELTAYLEALAQVRTGQTRREISNGELLTPVSIEEAVSKRTSDPRRASVVGEKRAFLQAAGEQNAWFAVLARLQELSPNSSTDQPLRLQAADPEGSYRILHHMLRRTQLDEHVYLTPAHSTDRDAIDEYLAAHHGELEPKLEQLQRTRGTVAASCRVWSASRAAAQGDLAPARDLGGELRRDWSPMLFGEASRSDGAACELLDDLLDGDLDFWSRREMIFEMIRRWPQARKGPRAKDILEEILAEPDGYGRYLVLEAMLYLQAATYPDAWDLSGHAEVWDKLAAARWSPLNDPARAAGELALIIDGLVWCPPRVADDEMARWLRPLAEAVKEHEPLMAAFLFASLYHPHGSRIFEELNILDPSETFGEHALSEGQASRAAELIQWHLVHQSRARALLYRRDLEPAHAYLLHRGTPPVGRALPPEQQRRCRHLVQALAAYPEHAGWAIHLGMNINATLGRVDDLFLAEIAERVSTTADLGVVSAVMTYQVPAQLRQPLVTYFAEDVNRAALLDAMRDGPVVWGTHMVPPRFNALRSPEAIHADLEIGWERLDADGLLHNGEQGFLAELHACAIELIETTPEPERPAVREHIWRVVAHARRGDRRALNEVRLRSTTGSGRPGVRERLRIRLQEAARAASLEGG